MMCMAAKCTIVEAENIVEAGEIEPGHVHIPSVYVHRIVQSKDLQRWIERRTVRKAS